jgi:hypothetical protein
MTRLILTSELIPDFTKSDFADLTVQFPFRFVWGPLPSPDELVTYLGARAPDGDPGDHWSTFASGWNRSKNRSRRDLGLVEFCQPYESVELWFDTQPNAQLQLVWLLDHFRPHPQILAKLTLGLVDLEMIGLSRLGRWRSPFVDITERELATASAAWQAYRAATPEACFKLLGQDLSALPLLRPVLNELLEELPAHSTGLGATEMRMLELIAGGYCRTNSLFHLRSLRQTRIYSEFEHGDLLEGLGLGLVPAVAGLDEELRTVRRDNFRDRLSAYHRSKLSLTEFGKAIVAHRQDFSRHNPIHRWWGGTELTSDCLWRYGSVLTAP